MRDNKLAISPWRKISSKGLYSLYDEIVVYASVILIHDLAFYVRKNLPFTRVFLHLKPLRVLIHVFSWLYFIYCLIFFSVTQHRLNTQYFDAVSSNLDKVLSSFANIFFFEYCSADYEDWLGFSDESVDVMNPMITLLALSLVTLLKLLPYPNPLLPSIYLKGELSYPLDRFDYFSAFWDCFRDHIKTLLGRIFWWVDICV